MLRTQHIKGAHAALWLLLGCLAVSLAQRMPPDPAQDYRDLAAADLEDEMWETLDPAPPAAPGLDLVYVENEGTAMEKRGGGKREGGDRYVCRPSREDVVRLLLALHDARGGNSGRTVSFCNRRRPATNILTNLRFLGRRR